MLTYSDEFHHAAANSYQELLSYYHPKILLGLTATPDRMDGKDILKYFDGRTASKMLLGEAIDRNLLSTFQYFGITDEVDYRKLKWTRGRYDTSELEKIYTADLKRCSLVLESVKKYVADMDEVKGLGFCVSVAYADYLASTLPLYAEQDEESMSENKKTYMEESLWEVEHFLAQENINRDQLNETLIDDMAYHYYKNYY